ALSPRPRQLRRESPRPPPLAGADVLCRRRALPDRDQHRDASVARPRTRSHFATPVVRRQSAKAAGRRAVPSAIASPHVRAVIGKAATAVVVPQRSHWLTAEG